MFGSANRSLTPGGHENSEVPVMLTNSGKMFLLSKLLDFWLRKLLRSFSRVRFFDCKLIVCKYDVSQPKSSIGSHLFVKLRKILPIGHTFVLTKEQSELFSRLQLHS